MVKIKTILFVIAVIYAIFALSVYEALADDGNMTDISFTQQLNSGLRFMGDMLKILAITLHQTDALVSEHQSEYPFLEEMLSGTNESEKSINTMINVTQMDMTNTSSIISTLNDVHNNLQSPADMMNVVNQTLGASNLTTPIILDMYNDVSNMTDVNNMTNITGAIV